MTRLMQTLTLLLALGALPAASAEGPGTDDTKDRTTYEWAVRAVGGYFEGMGVRTDSGALGMVELDLTPKLRLGTFDAEIPLRLDHRQTFGADLDETVVGAGLDLMKTSGTARWGWLVGATYTWRPNWPDLYQPDGAGGYEPTDRHSHFTGQAGWQYWNRLGDGRNLRAKIRYVHTVYPRDPNYDEADSVVHLAPRDNGTVKVDTSYRVLKKGFAYAVRADAYFRQDFVLLAKNADTGGTSRSNPEQRLLGLEPSAEIELRTRSFDLALGYSLMLQSDTFDGYYSYTGHSPYVRLQIAPNRPLSAEVTAKARRLNYGPNSKEATEDGKRLQDTRYSVKGGLRYALTKALALVGDVEWLQRETNFPDYVPGVYPATAQYDIDWDYTNVIATAGVEWKP